MKIESSKVEKLRITELDRIDPITVILEDIAQNQGKIIIECYGQSWSAYWGGMGSGSVAKFFCSCDEHYLANKLSSIKGDIDDYDALIAKARKHIIDRRKDGDLDRDVARSLYEDATYLTDYSSVAGNQGLMHDIFGDDWWHDIPQKPNPDYEYLCRIITAVQAALISTSVAKAA